MVVLILVIVFAVVILPPIVSGEGFDADNIFGDLTDWINNLIGRFTGGDATGITGVGFIVHCTDGSTIEYFATPTFSISPMSITVEDKPVDEIDIIVRARFDEDVGEWTADITQQIELYKRPSLTPLYSSTGDFTKNGQSWTNGTVKDLCVTTIEAGTFEELAEQYGGAVWNMQVTVVIDLEANIGGIVQTFEALTPSASMDFTYETDNAGPWLSVAGIEATTKCVPIN